jgi:hypothetical protein
MTDLAGTGRSLLTFRRVLNYPHGSRSVYVQFLYYHTRIDVLSSPRFLTIERRIDLLNSILGGEDSKKISTQLRNDNGDLLATIAKFKDILSAATLERASLIHSLSAITLDKSIVGTISNDPEITTLRDMALHYDNTKLAALATLSSFVPSSNLSNISAKSPAITTTTPSAKASTSSTTTALLPTAASQKFARSFQ